MVPWTHWREPRLGRLLTVLTSEFTHFNLVIRLSKVKQSALFRVSHCRSRCVEQRAAVPGTHFFLTLQLTADGEKPPSFQLCSRDRPLSQIPCSKATGHAFRCGSTSFLVLSVR